MPWLVLARQTDPTAFEPVIPPWVLRSSTTNNRPPWQIGLAPTFGNNIVVTQDYGILPNGPGPPATGNKIWALDESWLQPGVALLISACVTDAQMYKEVTFLGPSPARLCGLSHCLISRTAGGNLTRHFDRKSNVVYEVRTTSVNNTSVRHLLKLWGL